MTEEHPLINWTAAQWLDFQMPMRLTRMPGNRTAPCRPDFQEKMPEETAIRNRDDRQRTDFRELVKRENISWCGVAQGVRREYQSIHGELLPHPCEGWLLRGLENEKMFHLRVQF